MQIEKNISVFLNYCRSKQLCPDRCLDILQGIALQSDIFSLFLWNRYFHIMENSV